MRLHLKTMGAMIWMTAIGGSSPLKNKSKFASQREGKKNDAFSLKTIEEAKRVGELLKDQINEKEESCHKLEAEVVDLRKKV
jgi:hypothetical protein